MKCECVCVCEGEIGGGGVIALFRVLCVEYKIIKQKNSHADTPFSIRRQFFLFNIFMYCKLYITFTFHSGVRIRVNVYVCACGGYV